jgi:hypothetical protein
MFQLKRSYSRREIHNALGGGSVQSYLPTVNGRVVAGCFKTKLNPEAPYRIFAGAGPIIRSSAHIAAAQREPFPVFIKQGNKQFEFIGNYRGAGIDESATTIRDANRDSRRTNVTAVLTLERVD